jgi:hypothetical protein
MLKLKMRMRLVAILVGVAGASSLVSSEAAPPSKSVPAGKVFYTSDTALQGNALWSMNADGSGKQLLAYQPRLCDYAQLSHQVHQGHRWYLEFRTSPTPANGLALFAVRDDGDPDFVVPLVDDPDLEFNLIRWAKDDSFVSFTASDALDGTDLDHIYGAELDFDPETGLPFLAGEWSPVVDGEQADFHDIRAYDWSPDGTKVVYQLTGNPGSTSAMIADFVTGTTRVFAANGYAPVWSPDGTRIAYTLSDGIYVSNLEGTANLRITNNNSSHYDQTRGWSTDSQQVLFNRITIKSVKGGGQLSQSDVFRVPATGGTAVNLTNDINSNAHATYWR